MEAREIAEKLEGRKAGSFFSLTTHRAVKTFKGCESIIEKESIMQGMLCEYSNRAAVKDGVEDGIREEPELPTWVKEKFKLGNCNFWLGNTGEVYLCVPLTGNEPKAKWFMDGEECNYADVEPFLLASEKPKRVSKDELAEKGQVPFCGINVKNIIDVR